MKNKMPENYIPGHAYKQGHQARISGRDMPDSGNVGVYWDEYRAGWFDANRGIIESARKDITENKQFLQD